MIDDKLESMGISFSSISRSLNIFNFLTWTSKMRASADKYFSPFVNKILKCPRFFFYKTAFRFSTSKYLASPFYCPVVYTLYTHWKLGITDQTKCKTKSDKLQAFVFFTFCTKRLTYPNSINVLNGRYKIPRERQLKVLHERYVVINIQF